MIEDERFRRARPAGTAPATCCAAHRRAHPGQGGPGGRRRRQTFAEYNDSVNRLCAALSERGLAKGDRLALLAHNNWQYAVLVVAAAKLGIVLSRSTSC